MKKKQKKNIEKNYNAYSREAVAGLDDDFGDFDNGFKESRYDYYEGMSFPRKKSKKQSVKPKIKEQPKRNLTYEQKNMLYDDMWLAKHKDEIKQVHEQETFEDDRKYLLEMQDYLLKENKRIKTAQKEMSTTLKAFNLFIKENCSEPFEESHDLAWKKDVYKQKRAEFKSNFGDNVTRKLNNCENTKNGNEILKEHNHFLFKVNAIERTWVELARMTCEEQIQTVKRAGFVKKSEDMLEELNCLREEQVARENPRLAKEEMQQ